VRNFSARLGAGPDMPPRLALLAVLGLIAIPVTPAFAVAGSLTGAAIETNGTVNALASSSDRVYLAGSFTRAGAPTGSGADLSQGDGARNVAFARPNGIVNAVVSDGAGGWFIGGTFTRVGTLARNRVAHLLPSGAVDPAFDPNVNSDVQALVRSGTKLYAGGLFQVVNGTTVAAGGVARARLAAFDTTTGAVDPSFDPNVSAGVYALALSGSTLYAGGDFTTVNGATTRNRLAAFHMTTGVVDPSFDPNVTTSGSQVSALLLAGGTLYAGGSFTRVNGTSLQRQRLAAFDPATGTATSFDPDISSPGGTVSALALSGTTLYAGGDFTTVALNSATRNRLAAFSTADGSLVTSFDPNLDGAVDGLAAAGTRIYAGGTFAFAGADTIRTSIAAMRPDGTLDPAFAPSFGTAESITPTANALLLSGTTLYAGGNFINNVSNHLLAFDTATGARITAFNPHLNSPVAALALAGGRLYAGGDFTSVNGATVTRNRLAAFDAATGIVDAAFDPNVNSTVSALVVAAGKLYAGGTFTIVNGAAAPPGTARNRVAAFDLATGAVDATFNPNLNNAVTSLALSGTTLYAGGNFTLASCPATGTCSVANGAVTRNRLAAFDTAGTGTADATFNPNVGGGTVAALLRTGSRLYAGGAFTTVGGAPVMRLARFSEPPVAPAAVTGAASSVTMSGASLAGTVDPNEAATAYVFEYGTSLSFGSITTPDGAGSGDAAAPVSATLTDLAPTTVYYYRLVATNSAGTSFGAVASFATAGTVGAPGAATLPATSSDSTSTMLAGTVNPRGLQTAYTFEYGLTTTFGAITTVVALDSAFADEPVSVTLSGLSAGTTYLYRVVATNASGTTAGAVQSFTTSAAG
jgi:hypothetical protein